MLSWLAACSKAALYSAEGDSMPRLAQPPSRNKHTAKDTAAGNRREGNITAFTWIGVSTIVPTLCLPAKIGPPPLLPQVDHVTAPSFASFFASPVSRHPLRQRCLCRTGYPARP